MSVLPGVAAAAEPSPTPMPPLAIAIKELRADPPLYSASGAPLRLNAAEQARVRASIAATRAPIFVAILPGARDTTKVAGTARQLRAGVAKPGTYLAVVGTVWDTFSTELDAQPLLTRAFSEQRDNGTAAVISRFAELVGQHTRGVVPPPAGFPWIPTALGAGVIAILLAGYFIVERVRDRRQPETTAPAGPGQSTT
ncbi:MAG: hypothetical protein WBB44_04255 [Candidatus Nanopelagicales bacterium]|nr:hypothetical protein [Candidatus Nanopelagicales bacterium]